MKALFLLFIPLLFSACTSAEQKKVKPVATAQAENIPPTSDQHIRRQQAEAYCRAHGVPVYSNPNALNLDTDSAVTLRTKDSVVDRALALLYIGLKSEGLSPEKLAKLDNDWHIHPYLSPKEKAFAKESHPAPQQISDASWRYESLHILLWATGFIDSLPYPDSPCNVSKDVKIIHDLTEPTFRAKARLRSKKEILDKAELVLLLHWATEDARMNGKPAPAGIIPDVIQEWHYTLNWLIRSADVDWDDVSTDT